MLNLNSTKHLESDRAFASVSDHIDFSLLASFPFLSSVRTASVLIQSLKPFEPALIASSHPIISSQAISFLHSTSRHVFVSHRIASAPLKSSYHLRTCLFKSCRFFRSDLLDLSRFNSSKLFISKLVGSAQPIKSFRPFCVSSPRFGSPHRVKAVRVLFSSLRPFSSTTVIRFFSDRVFAHVRIKSSNLYKPYLFSLSYLVLPFLTESPKLCEQYPANSACQTQSERTKSLQHFKPFHLRALMQNRVSNSVSVRIPSILQSHQLKFHDSGQINSYLFYFF